MPSEGVNADQHCPPVTQVSRGGFRQIGMAFERLVGAPVPVPARMDQNGSAAHLSAGESGPINRAIHTACDSHDDGWTHRDPVEFKTGKIISVGIAMVRSVEIGSRVADHDNVDTNTRPVHSTLLSAGIPIVEHMTNLGALPITGFRFTAVPPKIQAMGTFPVRAHAIIQ